MAFLKVFQIDVFYNERHHTVFKRYTEFDRLNSKLVCMQVFLLSIFSIFYLFQILFPKFPTVLNLLLVNV